MNTSNSARQFILTAAIIAATLGLTPGLAWAQRANQPPAHRGPPPAQADRRPVQPAPPPSPAATDGAGWLGITMSEVSAEKARKIVGNCSKSRQAEASAPGLLAG